MTTTIKKTEYTDGIGAVRCGSCHTELYRLDQLPRVSLLRSDVEQLLCLLVDSVDCPASWVEAVSRLEHELGQSHAQIHALRSARA